MTTRLAGTLPRSVILQLRAEKERYGTLLADIAEQDERKAEAYLLQRRLFGQWDLALVASAHGPDWLKDPELANLVAESIHYRDGKAYDLMAFCIMPNHLHLVFTPLIDANGMPQSIVKIMQSLKGYTAHACNQFLAREGAFWQHESYDHWARDEAECERILRYLMANPVKAGLVDSWDHWRWTYIRGL